MVLPTIATSVGLPQIAGTALMNSLPGIGSAISALGGISSAFGGGKKRGPDLDDQYVAANKWAGIAFDQKMEMAEKYGISKLYMLGAQPTQLPSVSIGDNSGPSRGERLSMAGQDISRAGRALMSHGDRLDDTLQALSLERAGLENELLRSQISRVRQQSNPALANPGAQGLEAVIGDIPANQLGIADSIKPLYRVGYDQKGNPFRIFNDDLGDNDWAMAATLPVTGMDLYHGNVTRPLAKKLANGVRSLGRFAKGMTSYRPQYMK